MQEVAASINYPYASIKTSHQSAAINFKSMLTISQKVMFRKNRRLGLLLENGMNEFELASVLDTYGRTFPMSLNTLILNDSTIKTKFGLTVVCRSTVNLKRLDELHLLMPASISKEELDLFKHAKLIKYDSLQTQYPIDLCLKQISDQYGRRFKNVVKKLLDYN